MTDSKANPPLTLESIYTARARLEGVIRATPLHRSRTLSRKLGCDLYLKLENWQETGSFKVRGALNKLAGLTPEERARGVVTASAGNHGLGVAWASARLNLPARIVLPERASQAKVDALRTYSVDLVQHGEDYDEAEAFAWQLQQQEDLVFVHAFSDPQIIAGQGTVGLEIVEAWPEVATVVVPVGGGGLISGVALAIKSVKPGARILGVQSEASPAMYRAIRAGKPVDTPIADTVADGLAGRFVSELTLNLTLNYVDDVVLVSEDAIRQAVCMILDEEHMLVEGSAAVGLAALLEGQIPAEGKCVLVLTGRNLESARLKAML